MIEYGVILMEVEGETTVIIDFDDWSDEEKIDLIMSIAAGETWMFDDVLVTLEIDPPDYSWRD